nr:integrase DNA-binding domain-containing protein [Butyrivibrio sp. LC3010]
MAKGSQRRDSKHRVLRCGESIRANGKYQFKYHIGGKPHFVYSWRLEPIDPQLKGKKPDISLREKEKLIGYDLDSQIDPTGKNMTVLELVERYLATKTGVKHNTRNNYNFAKNILAKEPFGGKKISQVKTSDAKLFLIKLQKEDGRGYSSVKTIRGVLRPAFQMAVEWSLKWSFLKESAENLLSMRLLKLVNDPIPVASSPLNPVFIWV